MIKTIRRALSLFVDGDIIEEVHLLGRDTIDCYPCNKDIELSLRLFQVLKNMMQRQDIGCIPDYLSFYRLTDKTHAIAFAISSDLIMILYTRHPQTACYIVDGIVGVREKILKMLSQKPSK